MLCRSDFLSESRIQRCWLGYFLRVMCLFKVHTDTCWLPQGWLKTACSQFPFAQTLLAPRNRCFGILSFQGAPKTQSSCSGTSNTPFLPPSQPLTGRNPSPGLTPRCGKVPGSLCPAFILLLHYTKGIKKGLNSQTKRRASTHRVSLTILRAWLLLGILNFSVKKFIGVWYIMCKSLTPFTIAIYFQTTIVLFIKALKNSILVQKVIQCLSTV